MFTIADRDSHYPTSVYLIPYAFSYSVFFIPFFPDHFSPPQICHDLPCHRVFAPCVYHFLATLNARVCPLIFLFQKISFLGDTFLTPQTRYCCCRQSSIASMSSAFCIGRRSPGDNYYYVSIALCTFLNSTLQMCEYLIICLVYIF